MALKYFFIISICFLVHGCQSPTKSVLNDFKKVDSSLQNSATNLEQANKQLLQLTDSGSFKIIQTSANELKTFINKLKRKIIEIKDKTNEFLIPTFIIMERQKNAEKLFSKIEQFQELCISKIKSDSVEEKINNLFSGFRQNKKMQEDFFKQMPYNVAITALSTFYLDTENAENIIYKELLQHGL